MHEMKIEYDNCDVTICYEQLPSKEDIEEACVTFMKNVLKIKNEPAATDSKCKNSQNLHSYSNTGGTNVQI